MATAFETDSSKFMILNNSKQKPSVTLPVFVRGSDSLVEFGNEVNKFCLLQEADEKMLRKEVKYLIC